VKHWYQKADATIKYLDCVSHIKTMTGNNKTNHRDGKTKRRLLALLRSIDKKQADKDMDEMKFLEGRRGTLLSESSLKKDWLKPEEDIAWREL
jgi:hypothetical protein